MTFQDAVQLQLAQAALEAGGMLAAIGVLVLYLLVAPLFSRGYKR